MEVINCLKSTELIRSESKIMLLRLAMLLERVFDGLLSLYSILNKNDEVLFFVVVVVILC